MEFAVSSKATFFSALFFSPPPYDDDDDGGGGGSGGGGGVGDGGEGGVQFAAFSIDLAFRLDFYSYSVTQFRCPNLLKLFGRFLPSPPLQKKRTTSGVSVQHPVAPTL